MKMESMITESFVMVRAPPYLFVEFINVNEERTVFEFKVNIP